MHRRMAHFQTYRGNLLVCVENRTQTQEPLADSTKNNPLLGECVRRTKSALNRGKNNEPRRGEKQSTIQGALGCAKSKMQLKDVLRGGTRLSLERRVQLLGRAPKNRLHAANCQSR